MCGSHTAPLPWGVGAFQRQWVYRDEKDDAAEVGDRDWCNDATFSSLPLDISSSHLIMFRMSCYIRWGIKHNNRRNHDGSLQLHQNL